MRSRYIADGWEASARTKIDNSGPSSNSRPRSHEALTVVGHGGDSPPIVPETSY